MVIEMKKIENMTFDEERELYNIKDTLVYNCRFEGINDGESQIKESSGVIVDKSYFDLRYPIWHNDNFKILNSEFSINSRAPIWYSNNGNILNTKINSVKAIRECNNIKFNNCDIDSAEFAWKSNEIDIVNSKLVSEYAFFESKDIFIEDIEFSGKYSFQYVSNMEIINSKIDTKDAFWHSKNVVVKDSIINGEYLGWYSENLTLINCKIKGTQPLCYCKNLRLVDCIMENADLAFEYSSVEATIKGHIDSIKNPISGKIECDSLGENINSNSKYKSSCVIIINR